MAHRYPSTDVRFSLIQAQFNEVFGLMTLFSMNLDVLLYEIKYRLGENLELILISDRYEEHSKGLLQPFPLKLVQ